TIGAFIGGLALNNLPYNTAIFSKIRALRDFFLTIFFVSLGSSLDFSFSGLNIILVLIILILIFVFKPLIFFIINLLSGYGSRLSLEAGLSLAQVSEFGFVIAGLALSSKIFSEDLFSFIVTVSAVSMILTPHLISFAPLISNKISLNLNKLFKINQIKLFNQRIDDLRKIPPKEKLHKHIIIIGGGLIGRKLARKLKLNNKILIVDSDPEVVVSGKKEGLPFVYGTSEDAELLDELDLDDSKLVVITMASHKEGINFVNAIKRVYKNTCIFASSAHYYDSLNYYQNGVDFVSMPLLGGIDELYKKIDSFKSREKIFLSEKTKESTIKYIKEQSIEELKFKKKLIA
ncbi:MAG: cation:proton antiporter, partial [Candidatus ainarchaeum sp.]|nr:cation:proton antiporter [Candidatus ainarchaeum sp.]